MIAVLSFLKDCGKRNFPSVTCTSLPNGDIIMKQSICGFCLKPNPDQQCSKCKKVEYCSRSCQSKHWKIHRLKCVAKTEETKKTSGIPSEATG